MKNLKEYIIEGVGHSKMRLGAGSSGTAYDLGNGFVRKTLRVVVPGKSAREKEWKIIETILEELQAEARETINKESN